MQKQEPIVTTGLVMAPSGIATAISMLIVVRLVARTDPRILVSSGMLISALAFHIFSIFGIYNFHTFRYTGLAFEAALASHPKI